MAGRRGRAGRRACLPAVRGAALAVAALLLAACGDGLPDSSGARPDPAATPGLSPTPTGSGPGSGAPTLSADGALDCGAVAVAHEDLRAATDTELGRLDVDRSDQVAFGVTLFVATRQAPRYWAAVREALTPDADRRLRADVTEVAAHWDSLADDLATVELSGGSAAAVQRALDELDGVRASLPADRLDAVQVAQARAQAGVDRACADVLTAGSGVTPGDSAAASP